jgi:hypothetical protein
MISPPTTPTAEERDQRWRFFSDVAVFQLKMFISSCRDFALIPVSIAAALIDLVFRGKREGNLFYKVLRWGWHSEEMIDVYSPIRHDMGESKVNPNYTVDSVVARIERVLVREYEKGGTAASIKTALDQVIDQVHRETREKSDQARNVVARATDKLRLGQKKED